MSKLPERSDAYAIDRPSGENVGSVCSCPGSKVRRRNGRAIGTVDAGAALASCGGDEDECRYHQAATTIPMIRPAKTPGIASRDLAAGLRPVWLASESP